MSNLMDDPLTPDWFETPLGTYLLAAEQAYFDAEVVDVFGFNAFQLGFTRFDFLRANRMPFRCRVGDNGPVRIRADTTQLPILSNCADLVLMPHVLEFSDNPHQVLREVSRILMPEGHVIVAGFNPWSPWGLRRYFGRDREEFPWRGQFIALPRLKDWLKLLSFEVNRGRFGCYAPWVRTDKWLGRWRFMEKAGDRWWPVLGSIYMLTAVKRVRGMRLIGPAWKRKEERARALVPVANRSLFITDDAVSVQVDGQQHAANDGAPRAKSR